MTIQETKQLWTQYKDFHAYQRLLHLMTKCELIEITEKDFDRMLWWDDQEGLLLKDIHKQWLFEQTNVKESINEMKSEESPEFIREARLDYLYDELAVVNDYIEKCLVQYELNEKRGLDYNTRAILHSLWNIEDAERKQKKFLRLIHHYEKEDSESNTITEGMIDAAREYPIDMLLDFNSAGFALCPYHEESTPSFSHWKKANLGHCFGCHKTSDSIQLVRDTKKMTFPEAIYFLTK